MAKIQYKYIHAWGRRLGSFQYYIKAEIAKARQDNAPERAIFYSEEKERWVTVDEVSNEPLKAELIQGVEG